MPSESIHHHPPTDLTSIFLASDRLIADSQIDFVDALIVAIAERLNITSILTLDQRDFRLIRPRHCALLLKSCPED